MPRALIHLSVEPLQEDTLRAALDAVGSPERAILAVHPRERFAAIKLTRDLFTLDGEEHGPVVPGVAMRVDALKSPGHWELCAVEADE